MARLLSRLGRFSARHRWAVLISWLLAVAVLAVVALSGMKFGDGGFDVPGTPSSEAMSVLDEEFPPDDSDVGSLQLVIQNPDGDIVDAEVMTSIADALADVRDIDGVESVSDPFDQTRPYISEDLSTAVATVSVDNASEAQAATERRREG